jgi:hypothetical protein
MKYMIIFYRTTFLPIHSLIGHFVLRTFTSNRDNPVWQDSFHNKNVLIAGTGPSLDKVPKSYFLSFDTIIYINHAIKISGKVDCEYFFTTDPYVAKKIEDKDYYKNIISLGPEKSILAPIFFDKYLFLSRSFKRNFSWIPASNIFLNSKRREKTILGVRFPYIIRYWPVQPDFESLEKWFNTKEQIKYFPIMEHTSALSSILFAAKYKPQSISLIGCDFSSGRSESIASDCPGRSINVFSEAVDSFYFLEKYFSEKNIYLKNDSWLYVN